MEPTEKPIAVVQGASSAVIQQLFDTLVRRWRPTLHIAGVIEEGHELADWKRSDGGRLRSIADGSCYPIFQDLGAGSMACQLEGSGAAAASEAVRRDIAAGCDLVVLSKFGKLEMGNEGLVPAFVAAMEAGVPILTSISPMFRQAWADFADPLFVVLPAEPEAVEAWLRGLLSRRVVGAASLGL
jgi:glycosyltransferase involved in cell wall biosynthesis